MSRKRLIREYKRSLCDIKKLSESIGVNNHEFDDIFNECLDSLTYRDPTKIVDNKPKTFYIRRILSGSLSMLLITYFVYNYFDYKPISLFLCKIQEYIYPGLRFLRILAIPLISVFPSLTELYDETCLIQNPYFRISDMDCRPCHSVEYVSEVYTQEFDPFASPPFLYKVEQKYVSYFHLQKLYNDNKKVFDRDAPKIFKNNDEVLLISDFFTKDILKLKRLSMDNYQWRINRMLPGQLVRTLFPRPNIVPRLGLSTERYILLDGPQTAAYKLPDSDCNFVFMIQSQGERLIELQPANECLNQCKTIKVLLTPSYLLWYNWWYWRPVSHPTNSNSSSTSYIGSYC